MARKVYLSYPRDNTRLENGNEVVESRFGNYGQTFSMQDPILLC